MGVIWTLALSLPLPLRATTRVSHLELERLLRIISAVPTHALHLQSTNTLLLPNLKKTSNLKSPSKSQR
jgi:hypothetical protein